jgi:hypothetical protein
MSPLRSLTVKHQKNGHLQSISGDYTRYGTSMEMSNAYCSRGLFLKQPAGSDNWSITERLSVHLCGACTSNSQPAGSHSWSITERLGVHYTEVPGSASWAATFAHVYVPQWPGPILGQRSPHTYNRPSERTSPTIWRLVRRYRWGERG